MIPSPLSTPTEAPETQKTFDDVVIGHAYEPFSLGGSPALKYQGGVTRANTADHQRRGHRIEPNYKGDRLWADSLEPVPAGATHPPPSRDISTGPADVGVAATLKNEEAPKPRKLGRP